jgi:LysR family transcriptional regulator, glycine cleavage system transcriptional activator
MNLAFHDERQVCRIVELHRLLVFENSSLIYQGAIDGLGVALAQLSFVQDDLNTGRPVIANPLQVETDVAYFLTYPRERAHLRRIKLLEEWITLAWLLSPLRQGWHRPPIRSLK